MKLKYNSSGVDRSQEELTAPAPGVYPMKIESATIKKRDGQSDLIEFVLRMQKADAEGKGKGYGFWDRVATDLDWKVDQYLLAIGIDTEANPEGTVDVPKDFVGKTVMGRVISATYNDEYSPKLKRVLPFVEGDDEEGWDASSEMEADDDAAPSDGDDLTEPDEPTAEDILGLGASADDDEDGEAMTMLSEIGAAAGLDPDEYPTWGDLAEAIVETMVPAEKPKPVKAAAKKAAAKPKPDPEPAADEDDDIPYEAWELNDLKAEASSRGISDKGPMSAIIARLRKADSDPFAG